MADIVFQHSDGRIAIWLMQGLNVKQGIYVDVPLPIQRDSQVIGPK